MWLRFSIVCWLQGRMAQQKNTAEEGCSHHDDHMERAREGDVSFEARDLCLLIRPHFSHCP